MHQPRRSVGWPLRVLASVAGIALVIGGAVPARAQDQSESLDAWVGQTAVTLRTTDPDASLDDLEPLRRSIGDAEIVGLGESTHGTANAPELRVVVPGGPDWRYSTAGSYLRRWYGQRYLSIGFTLDHGTVSLGEGETATLPPPKPEWFESPFGEVDLQQFALDLRSPAPTPVRRWLEGPIQTRGFADAGPDSSMSGGSLAQWFDVIVHRQEGAPASPT